MSSSQPLAPRFAPDPPTQLFTPPAPAGSFARRSSRQFTRTTFVTRARRGNPHIETSNVLDEAQSDAQRKKALRIPWFLVDPRKSSWLGSWDLAITLALLFTASVTCALSSPRAPSDTAAAHEPIPPELPSACALFSALCRQAFRSRPPRDTNRCAILHQLHRRSGERLLRCQPIYRVWSVLIRPQGGPSLYRSRRAPRLYRRPSLSLSLYVCVCVCVCCVCVPPSLSHTHSLSLLTPWHNLVQFFILDLLLQFVLIVPSSSAKFGISNGAGGDGYLADPRSIARAYLRGWFGIDLLSVLVR